MGSEECPHIVLVLSEPSTFISSMYWEFVYILKAAPLFKKKFENRRTLLSVHPSAHVFNIPSVVSYGMGLPCSSDIVVHSGNTKGSEKSPYLKTYVTTL